MASTSVPSPTTPSPFDPTAFLDLAKDLASKSNDEVILRCSVGRLYYGVFLVGRDLFGMENQPFKEAHRELQTRLKRKKSAMGSLLNSLHELRKVADYDMIPEASYSNWDKNWSDALYTADALMKQFQQWRSDTTFPIWLMNQFP